METWCDMCGETVSGIEGVDYWLWDLDGEVDGSGLCKACMKEIESKNEPTIPLEEVIRKHKEQDS